MQKDTLLRALAAVRVKIATADAKAADWLAERDRRRRQEAAFLRGIVRLEGSMRKAALAANISRRTLERILDPEGHAKDRAYRMAKRRQSGATFAEVAPPPAPDNVVKLRRRRPDWKPCEPRRTEIRRWFEQYLGWCATAQATARMLVFNAKKGELPDAAYFNDDEPRPVARNRAMGT